MTYTRELAEYSASLTYDDLPEETVLSAKRVTLDLLGVTAAAVRYGPGTVMNEYVRSLGGPGTSTVIATGIRTTASSAALANGTMAADMEQDDVHPESNLHASSVFVPALLAAAERADVSGREWIVALTAAYEVGCRLSIAMDNSRQYARGFHPTAVSGVFGATAGIARALRFSADQTVMALGLAGCQAAGLLTWELEPGHYTKSFQSGFPARSAVTAAELVEHGFIGAPDIFDGRFNVFDVFSTHRNFPRLVEGLGLKYEIDHTGYKFYSCCRAIHSTLDTVLGLQREHQFSPEDVESIDVKLPETLAPMVDNNTLITHNLQYIVAAAMTDGVVGREQTTEERRADPALQKIADRISLSGDPELQKLFPVHWCCRVTLRTTDGSTFQVQRDDPRGTVADPVASGDIEDKFLRMTAGVYDAARATEITQLVSQLEKSSVRDLAALLGAS